MNETFFCSLVTSVESFLFDAPDGEKSWGFYLIPLLAGLIAGLFRFGEEDT